MTGSQHLDAGTLDIDTADGPSSAEQQGDGSAKVSVGDGKTGNSAAVIREDAKDRAPVTPSEIRSRHSRHLEELIDRGKDLAIEMFDDAGNREFEETRRIQFVRLADRVTDTTRKLIVSYDRHCQKPG